MTMVPAENLSKQQQHHRNNHHHLLYSGYGGCGGGLMSRIQGYDYSGSEAAACLGSDLVVVVNNNNNKSMAEDESRTNSLNEAASSSKDNQEEDHRHQKDDRWLQLSIGTHATSHDIKHGDHHQVDPTAARRGGLIELDLLHGGDGGSSQQARASSIASTNFHMGSEFRPPPRPLMNIAGATGHSTSLFFQQGSSSTFPHHQEINWAFRPVPPNIALASSSSPSSLMQFGSYFSRPFQAHTGVDVAGPSSDFRVIDPPRRPHSGIWFMLLASQNQAKEPFLPQISKSYLRIKDGRMTVQLLLKYLVNKLRLDSESEIEITCRGQQLLPFLTLQHIRDNIWSPRDAVTLLPDSSTSDHVMVLHYARSA